ncbi:MAG: tol-pal system protein YbgF [Nitrospiraceae bacterium]|nr:tol-pal system protein YbgF [Nitrospiraceae bacterium]
MKTGKLIIPAFFAMALSLWGCAGNDAVKQNINDLASQTYSLRQELDSLKADVNKTRQEEPSRAEALQAIKGSQADIMDQVSSLQKDVQSLRSSFEEGQHTTGKLLSEQSRTATALSNRIDVISQKIDGQGKRIDLLETSLKQVQTQQQQQSVTPEQEYAKAQDLFTQGKYPDARDAFTAFIKKYPGNKLAANAQFWIGETYYKDKDYDSAILAYEEVMKKYPDSEKAPAALLKQGLAFMETGDNKVAAAVFSQLLDRYPKSGEAATAKEKLSELKKPVKKRKK